MAAATSWVAPVTGLAASRFPLRRSRIALVVVGLTATMWTLVLVVPPLRPPLGLLVALVIVLSRWGGPASVIGFDIARTSNPALGPRTRAEHRQHSPDSPASLLVLVAVGVVVDLCGGYGPEAFRWAWLTMYPVWVVGVTGVVVTRRRTRALEASLAREAQPRGSGVVEVEP